MGLAEWEYLVTDDNDESLREEGGAMEFDPPKEKAAVEFDPN